MAMEAFDVIKGVVGDDWSRMTKLAQRIKFRPAFGDYGKAVRGMHDAARAGVIEMKSEREAKTGPKTVYVRIKK